MLQNEVGEAVQGGGSVGDRMAATTSYNKMPIHRFLLIKSSKFQSYQSVMAKEIKMNHSKS